MKAFHGTLGLPVYYLKNVLMLKRIYKLLTIVYYVTLQSMELM
jgi:hypothetical protein